MSEVTCECGGNIKKTQAKGGFFPYAEYGIIKLTKSCQVLICESCGEYYENAADDSLAKALHASLTDNFVQLLEVIKERHPNIREAQLAFFCGLAASTFSRCKNKSTGKVIPSYAFLLLKGVAKGGRVFMNNLLDDTSWADNNATTSGSEAATTPTGFAASSYGR